jgi:hypothetical protein
MIQGARLFETINEHHVGVRRDNHHQLAARRFGRTTVIVIGITKTLASSSAKSLISML